MEAVQLSGALKPLEWHYYKIYVGGNHDALDFVITDCLASALTLVESGNWFYLRYFDEGGLHLRLRVHLHGGEGSAQEREFYHQLHDGLSLLSQRVPSTYVPLVYFDGYSVLSSGEDSSIYCCRDRYIAELDVFGGEHGMPIAEEVFCLSSDIAREVLLRESQAELSRKDSVLPFFVETLQMFLSEDACAEFLERYSTFWLSGNPDIGNYKSAFIDKANAMLDANEAIVPPTQSQHPSMATLITRWHKAMRNARERYKKECPLYTPMLADTLAFYFAHLMNNRLGFTTLDESYLAILLAKTYERGLHHASA